MGAEQVAAPSSLREGGSAPPATGRRPLCHATPPSPLAVNPAVRLQYVDNIRWIREAARHQLVRAQPWGRQGWAPGEGLYTSHETA